MKRMQFALLFLVFGFIIAFSACEKKPKDRKTIAVSMIGETHKWPVGVRYYAEEEVKKIAKENVQKST